MHCERAVGAEGARSRDGRAVVQLQNAEIARDELPAAEFPAAARTRFGQRASPRGRHRAEREEAVANSGENTHRDNYCSLS